jgi:uracil-DNA glycosylase family 4
MDLQGQHVKRPETLRALDALEAEITLCRACPRLVEWRETSAIAKPRRYQAWEYWARPLPGFGDPNARLLILGLAPAKDGGNRTGRIFTGDRSGDWLFAALHRAGYANQPTSEHRDDGLTLTDCFISAAVRCAPPDNKPSNEERDRCAPWLHQEIALLPGVKAVLALGSFAWAAALTAFGPAPRPKPKFGHGAVATLPQVTLVGSYHVSQQNTFTGKLTEEMLDAAIATAKHYTE